MERMLAVMPAADARSAWRTMITVVTLVGGMFLVGCSSPCCHRCHSRTTQKCQTSTCPPECATDVTRTVTEPNELSLTTKPVVQHSTVDNEQQPSSQPMYGHGENYEWLIGVLHRVHIPRKGWKVRYAPLDQLDPWGGSVVPAPDARTDAFEDGDIVYVEGEIIRDRANLYVSGPQYRITAIRHVNERDSRRAATTR